MPQSIAAWDVDLYGCPLVSGYAVDQSSALRVGVPLSGTRRYRRLQDEPMLSANLSVLQQGDQHRDWLTWFRTVLDHGRYWFTIDLLWGTETLPLIAHIAGEYSVELLDTAQADHCTLSFSIEAFRRESVPLDQGLAFFINGGTPDTVEGFADFITAGTPAAPSSKSFSIWGGEGLGFPPPVGSGL